MSNFASIGTLVIDALRKVAADGTGENRTVNAMRPRVGSVGQLAYKLARLRYLVNLNQASAAGAATLTLVAGSLTLATIELDLTSAEAFSGSVDIDLSEVSGSTPIYANLNVTTAADAGTVAEVTALLDVEIPLVVSGC